MKDERQKDLFEDCKAPLAAGTDGRDDTNAASDDPNGLQPGGSNLNAYASARLISQRQNERRIKMKSQACIAPCLGNGGGDLRPEKPAGGRGIDAGRVRSVAAPIGMEGTGAVDEAAPVRTARAAERAAGGAREWEGEERHLPVHRQKSDEHEPDAEGEKPGRVDGRQKPGHLPTPTRDETAEDRRGDEGGEKPEGDKGQHLSGLCLRLALTPDGTVESGVDVPGRSLGPKLRSRRHGDSLDRMTATKAADRPSIELVLKTIIHLPGSRDDQDGRQHQGRTEGDTDDVARAVSLDEASREDAERDEAGEEDEGEEEGGGGHAPLAFSAWAVPSFKGQRRKDR